MRACIGSSHRAGDRTVPGNAAGQHLGSLAYTTIMSFGIRVLASALALIGVHVQRSQDQDETDPEENDGKNESDTAEEKPDSVDAQSDPQEGAEEQQSDQKQDGVEEQSILENAAEETQPEGEHREVTGACAPLS